MLKKLLCCYVVASGRPLCCGLSIPEEISLSPWFPPTNWCRLLWLSLDKWLSLMIWWRTPHYGNSLSHQRQKERRGGGKSRRMMGFFPLSSPSHVPVESDSGTAMATCTSCTVMNGLGSGGVAMTGSLARAAMQMPLFSGHVCTLFHRLVLLGWYLRGKACLNMQSLSV